MALRTAGSARVESVVRLVVLSALGWPIFAEATLARTAIDRPHPARSCKSGAVEWIEAESHPAGEAFLTGC